MQTDCEKVEEQLDEEAQNFYSELADVSTWLTAFLEAKANRDATKIGELLLIAEEEINPDYLDCLVEQLLAVRGFLP